MSQRWKYVSMIGRGSKVGVGADQKGRSAIQQLGAFAQAVGERGDDEELQQATGAGGTPQQFGSLFVAERMGHAGMHEAHGLPGLGVVGAELFGSGDCLAVAKTAAAGFTEGGIRGEAYSLASWRIRPTQTVRGGVFFSTVELV